MLSISFCKESSSLGRPFQLSCDLKCAVMCLHRVELGRAYHKLGKREDAWRELEAAILLDQEDINAHLQKVLTLQYCLTLLRGSKSPLELATDADWVMTPRLVQKDWKTVQILPFRHWSLYLLFYCKSCYAKQRKLEACD